MDFPEIGPVEAHANLGSYRLIDVRQPHEFNGPLGFIDGAELVPMGNLAKHFEHLDSTRPLLLVCRSGKRSEKACESLQSLGIRDVTNLAGGMIAWNREGLPVLRTELKNLEALVASVVEWLAMVTATDATAVHYRVEALLLEAGTTVDEPTAAAVDHVLDVMSRELRESGAPPDLEMALDAYRRDLADLQEPACPHSA